MTITAKYLKSQKFDVFYIGTKYCDQKQLSYEELNRLLEDIEYFDGDKWENIFYKTIYSEVYFYNLVETFKQHNYIVALTGEMERDLHLKLLGESSIMKELAKSNYREKARKLQEKEKGLITKARGESTVLLMDIRDTIAEAKLEGCFGDEFFQCLDKINTYWFKSDILKKVKAMAYMLAKNQIEKKIHLEWNVFQQKALIKVLDNKIKRKEK